MQRFGIQALVALVVLLAGAGLAVLPGSPAPHLLGQLVKADHPLGPRVAPFEPLSKASWFLRRLPSFRRAEAMVSLMFPVVALGCAHSGEHLGGAPAGSSRGDAGGRVSGREDVRSPRHAFGRLG